MVRYFKKFDPRIQVSTGMGFNIPFDEIRDDNGNLFEWGILATSDGYLISELEKLIQRQQGGVQEIGQDEHDALKKKEQPILSRSLKAVRRPHLVQLIRDAAQEVVAAAKAPELPKHFTGIQAELQTMTRPLGVINNWKPASVAR